MEFTNPINIKQESVQWGNHDNAPQGLGCLPALFWGSCLGGVYSSQSGILQEATIKMIRTQEVFVCFVKRSGPQLRQEKVRRPQNLSLLNDLEPPPLSLSLAPYI